MSNIAVKKNMNLHEECLIKYLINPTELLDITELLKINNELLKKNKFDSEEFANINKVNYTFI
jgi:hypothetical protein